MGELIDMQGARRHAADKRSIDDLIRRGKELGIDVNPDPADNLLKRAARLEMHGISIKHVATVSVPADTLLSVEELDDLVMDALDCQLGRFEVEYEFIKPRAKRRRR